DYVLIDVRRREEVEQGSIPTAKHVPVADIGTAFLLPPTTFAAVYGFKPPAKDANIIFYCKSGVRSLIAVKFARDLGFANTKTYEGSWDEWDAEAQKPKPESE
ncbi:Rhodanese-like domain-containing protein, partial [Blyttiomyces helicus]